MTTIAQTSSLSAAGPSVNVRIGTEIRNIGIPPRPAILGRIETEMRKDEPDFQNLAKIIASDVGLAASVIKVANLPYYGFGKRVGSVGDALLILGLKTIIQTIAGIALQKIFPHIPSLDRFWDSAARTARLSAWLTTQLALGHGIRADDAYTFGLFRDCGIPVLMIPFPDYIDTLRRANEEMLKPFTTVEDEALAINHATIGVALAKDWRLADVIVSAMHHHHDLAYLQSTQPPGGATYLIAIGQLAEHLIQRITGLNQTQEWGKLGTACLTLLGVTEEAIAMIENDAKAIISQEL